MNFILSKKLFSEKNILTKKKLRNFADKLRTRILNKKVDVYGNISLHFLEGKDFFLYARSWAV